MSVLIQVLIQALELWPKLIYAQVPNPSHVKENPGFLKSPVVLNYLTNTSQINTYKWMCYTCKTWLFGISFDF